MAVTERALLEPVSDFINAATGQRPFPAKENLTLPATDFMSMELLSSEPISWTHTAQRYLDGDPFKPQFLTQYIMTVRVTAFGDTAFEYLSAITAGLRNKQFRTDHLRPHVSYQEHTAIRDASIPIDNTKIEKRYTTIIQFGYISGDEYDANWIQTVADPTFVGDYNI